jgi:hypothetical protein
MTFDNSDQSSENLEISMLETPHISPELYQKLQATLLRCGAFRRDSDLPPLFVDSRISVWRDDLPSANSPSKRVQAVVDYLLPQANAAGENALVLFLRVLADHKPSGDACHGQLEALAGALERTVHSGGVENSGTSPVPPAPSPKGPLSARLKRQLIQALLACPTIGDRHTRDTVVSELPTDVRSNIRRNTADRVDVSNIVTACMHYEGGLSALIESVRFYEGDSIPRRDLDAVWEKIL